MIPTIIIEIQDGKVLWVNSTMQEPINVVIVDHDNLDPDREVSAQIPSAMEVQNFSAELLDSSDVLIIDPHETEQFLKDVGLEALLPDEEEAKRSIATLIHTLNQIP